MAPVHSGRPLSWSCAFQLGLVTFFVSIAFTSALLAASGGLLPWYILPSVTAWSVQYVLISTRQTCDVPVDFAVRVTTTIGMSSGWLSFSASLFDEWPRALTYCPLSLAIIVKAFGERRFLSTLARAKKE